ncbi:MAG: trigger factor [Gammaproteobacteria bacterium BRH_c0]|nr:MAG: trigger factor [Gammaproteobacteria bacterium BRH_c0]
MQVSIETTSGLERRMTIGVPAAQVENEVTARLQKAARSVRLDGFRAGKVPFKVVQQRFGAGVRQEVIGEVVSKSFQEAVNQEKLRPAGQPSIESLTDNPGQDLEFVAAFEVYPEIELQDFATLSVTKPVAEVNDADVEKMIDVLRNQNAQWVAVERAAQKDDQVKIDYTGRKDGEEFDGGKASGSLLVLGSGQMIPGFEDALVGMKAGDSKTVSLSFPEDYHSEDLKGAAVEFDLHVHEVQEKQLPELNDEFFAKFGIKEGGKEKFVAEVRNNMERELRNAIKNKVKTRLMNQLREKHSVEVPASLVKEEVGALRRQMLSQFGGGQNFDESLLPDELFAGDAERRVALGLIVASIIESAEIKTDAAQVRQQIEEIASTYEEPEEVVRYYYSNQQLLVGVQSSVLEDQVVEHVLQSATLIEEPCSYEEAVQPDKDNSSDEEAAD